MYGLCGIRMYPDGTVKRINLPDYAKPREIAESQAEFLNSQTVEEVTFFAYKIA